MAVRLSVKTDHPHGPVLVDQNGEPVRGIMIERLDISAPAQRFHYGNGKDGMVRISERLEIKAEILIEDIYDDTESGAKGSGAPTPMHWSGRPLRMMDMDSTNKESPEPAGGTIDVKGKEEGDDR